MNTEMTSATLSPTPAALPSTATADMLGDTTTPTSATLRVTLNGEAIALPAGSTLAALLAVHPAAREQSPNGYASAINGDFVPRGLRATTVLADGDAVTLFQAIVGG